MDRIGDEDNLNDNILNGISGDSVLENMGEATYKNQLVINIFLLA